MSRTPNDIMTDFDDGYLGLRDIDMHEVLWEIINDLRDSYDLAMKSIGLGESEYVQITDTVGDYIANNYGSF